MKTAIKGFSFLCFLLLSVNTFAQTNRNTLIGPGNEGCTYLGMYNYDPTASIDDGSCYPLIE